VTRELTDQVASRNPRRKLEALTVGIGSTTVTLTW
jgi:hypothetical protein